MLLRYKTSNLLKLRIELGRTVLLEIRVKDVTLDPYRKTTKGTLFKGMLNLYT